MSFWITSRSPVRVAVVLESGVVELEFLGSVEAGHEGRDQRPILLLHAVHAGPVDRLGGDLLLESVQFLVKIHDQQMQTVVFGLLRRGDPDNRRPGDPVFDEGGHLGDQLLESLLVP